MAKLFKESEDWENNAVIKKHGDKWMFYSLGYEKAAEVLERHLVEDKNGSFLIVVFKQKL